MKHQLSPNYQKTTLDLKMKARYMHEKYFEPIFENLNQIITQDTSFKKLLKSDKILLLGEKIFSGRLVGKRLSEQYVQEKNYFCKQFKKSKLEENLMQNDAFVLIISPIFFGLILLQYFAKRTTFWHLSLGEETLIVECKSEK